VISRVRLALYQAVNSCCIGSTAALEGKIVVGSGENCANNFITFPR
jgi:hypothetical protein